MLTIGSPEGRFCDATALIVEWLSFQIHLGEGVANAPGRFCVLRRGDEAMDSAVLLLNIYKCYRERRLAEAVSLLSDDFVFKSDLPDDPLEPQRPRSRAELTILAHRFLEEYEIISFEPGPVTVNGNNATVFPECVFQHKKTGKILHTRFEHIWHIDGGKLAALHQRHDGDQLRTFLQDLGSGVAP